MSSTPKTAETLEKEAGVFFDMSYFEGLVTDGHWKEAETYLSGFTKFEDNDQSMEIFVEFWTQKYLEAVDGCDFQYAVEMLRKELKLFSTLRPVLFEHLTMVLALDDYRKDEFFRGHGDTKFARANMLEVLQRPIRTNPLLRDKIKNSTLRTLNDQSQHNEADPPSSATAGDLVPLSPSVPGMPFLAVSPRLVTPPGWGPRRHQAVSAGPSSSSVPHQAASAGHTSPFTPYGGASAAHTSAFTPYGGASAGCSTSSVPRSAVSAGPSSLYVSHPASAGCTSAFASYQGASAGRMISFVPHPDVSAARRASSVPRRDVSAARSASVPRSAVSACPSSLYVSHPASAGCTSAFASYQGTSAGRMISFVPHPDVSAARRASSVPRRDVSAGPSSASVTHRDPLAGHMSVPAPFYNTSVGPSHPSGSDAPSRPSNAASFEEMLNYQETTTQNPELDLQIGNEAYWGKAWKQTEISDLSQLRARLLDGVKTPVKIGKLVYTTLGDGLLALRSDGTHVLWKWLDDDGNAIKATSGVAPVLWMPSTGVVMTNDLGSGTRDQSFPCCVISRNDSLLLSASGGPVSLYAMMTSQTILKLMAPPHVATSLCFHPQNNRGFVIGMYDATIVITYYKQAHERKVLNGHKRSVTGLAVSNKLNMLVSSCTGRLLCVWSVESWEMEAKASLQIPTGRPYDWFSPTRVQFHRDEIHVLAVHCTQVAIFEVPSLNCISQLQTDGVGVYILVNKQWLPQKPSNPITDAAFSCDGESIFVGFNDGSVSVFVFPTLVPKCIINQAAYLQSPVPFRCFPVSIAAHPSVPNQFAVGLSNGLVYVLEPLESKPSWGSPPPEIGESSTPAN